MRKKKEQRNPRGSDLPTNPEFQRFAGVTGAIVNVPKTEIDRLLAEEREAKEHSEPCEGEPLDC